MQILISCSVTSILRIRSIVNQKMSQKSVAVHRRHYRALRLAIKVEKDLRKSVHVWAQSRLLFNLVNKDRQPPLRTSTSYTTSALLLTSIQGKLVLKNKHKAAAHWPCALPQHFLFAKNNANMRNRALPLKRVSCTLADGQVSRGLGIDTCTLLCIL